MFKRVVLLINININNSYITTLQELSARKKTCSDCNLGNLIT